jgi:hypothetical protein
MKDKLIPGFMVTSGVLLGLYYLAIVAGVLTPHPFNTFSAELLLGLANLTSAAGWGVVYILQNHAVAPR